MKEVHTISNDWRDSAELLRMLGHPVRLALLAELAEGPRCVTRLHQLLDVRQANMSQHLAVLRRARLVDYHEEGNERCYYLSRPDLARALLKFLDKEYPVRRLSKKEVKRRAGQRGRQEGAACAARYAEKTERKG